MFERTLLLTLALSSLAFPACGDDSGGDGDGSAGTAGTEGMGATGAEDCPERCADKAETCGAPADVAAAQCQSVCGAMLSEDSLQCLEDEDCTTLGQVLLGSGGSACGLGGGSASGGSASGGSASGGTPDADIGDDCECSDAEVAFETCSGSGSSCGELTCYVVFGDGICSQPCTADLTSDDCPSGTCTLQNVNGLDVGQWCVP